VSISQQVDRLAQAVRRSRSVVVFTGAGFSTESGLSDYRSPTGLWRRRDPAEVASVQALRRNPREFCEFYRRRLRPLAEARPNPAHLALARLQRRGLVHHVVTQNVDGLHQRAGSRDVVELHGSLARVRCDDCARLFPPEAMGRPEETEEPARCRCGGLLRPDVVLFGESLPREAIEAAVEAACNCDLFCVAGSSLTVSPANSLPMRAARRGAFLAIVNLEPTPYDRMAALVIRARVGRVFPALSAALTGDNP